MRTLQFCGHIALAGFSYSSGLFTPWKAPLCFIMVQMGMVVWRRMLAKRAQKGKSALLALALNNLSQGVVMFDMAERLIVCNDR